MFIKANKHIGNQITMLSILRNTLRTGRKGFQHRAISSQCTKTTIQYVSDLHVDFHVRTRRKIPKITAKAPYLLIAGDVCNGVTDISRRYLKDVASQFDQVVMVPGNHDFYNTEGIEVVEQELRELESQIPNFKVLMNEETILPSQGSEENKIRILGTTLWSEIPKEHHDHYQKKSLEFKNIRAKSGKKLTPYINNEWHDRSLAWLVSQAKKPNPNKTIVLTHHAPLIEGTCRPIYYNQNRVAWLNHGFCTDLSEIISKVPSNWLAWIFGHTHYRCSFQPEEGRGITLASNPLGFVKKGNKVNVPVRLIKV